MKERIPFPKDHDQVKGVHSLYSTQYSTGSPSQSNQKEKDTKGSQTEKEEYKTVFVSR